MKVFKGLPTRISRLHNFKISTESFQSEEAHNILEASINLGTNYIHFFALDLFDILGEGDELSGGCNAF